MLRSLTAASLFGAGIAVGVLVASARGAPAPSAVPVSAPDSTAIEIQSTGSVFLASLTRLQSSDGSADPEAGQARSAALAVVQGTAAELLRLDPADRTAYLALRAVAGERRPSSTPATSPVWTAVEF